MDGFYAARLVRAADRRTAETGHSHTGAALRAPCIDRSRGGSPDLCAQSRRRTASHLRMAELTLKRTVAQGGAARRDEPRRALDARQRAALRAAAALVDAGDAGRSAADRAAGPAHRRPELLARDRARPVRTGREHRRRCADARRSTIARAEPRLGARAARLRLAAPSRAAGNDEARDTGRSLALEWVAAASARAAARRRAGGRRAPRSSPGSRMPTCCSRTPTRRRTTPSPPASARSLRSCPAAGATRRRLSAPAGADGAGVRRPVAWPATSASSRTSSATLAAELDRQILRRRRPRQRAIPALLVELLLDLLPLRPVLRRARPRAAAEQLSEAIAAHDADAALSCASATACWRASTAWAVAAAAGLATVLAYDDGSTPPLAARRARPATPGSTRGDRPSSGRRRHAAAAGACRRGPGRLPVVRDERRDASCCSSTAARRAPRMRRLASRRARDRQPQHAVPGREVVVPAGRATASSKR